VIAVIGGGCFGTYHTRQVLKAVRAGRLPGEQLLVVDRNPDCAVARTLGSEPEVALFTDDWLAFLRVWLPEASPADHIVPNPLAPHLLWEWLAAELDCVELEAPRDWGLPYEWPGGQGEVFLSAAAWVCPTTCVEPAHCPALHAPRDWDLADLIEARAVELGYVPLVLRCLHLASGVGTIPVAEVLAARDRARGTERALVATSSRCHAAVGALGRAAAVARVSR
jgi:hypothetical protein